MSNRHSSTTRRAFLSRIAAGSAAAVTLPLVETPASIVAANDVPDPKEFADYFAAGTLLEVASDYIGIHAPGYLPGLLRIMLTPQTQICARGSCTTTWTSLQHGDRIETATIIGPGGVRHAQWVNANVVAGMGTLSAINDNIVTITPWMEMGVTRDLSVNQNTVVRTSQGEVKGQAAALKVGDDVHFTALADDPNPHTRPIHGVVVSQLEKMG